jgi:3-deoxy-D-arabino-heptulosonate 7-phosphate (DAHP) synthase class II|tara:strand:- start:431 stop:586 length:156 start_codon:yes stop_codon:yes gene_type:complete
MTQKEEFNKALEILEEIEENVGVCCAVTMEPDEVLELIDKLKEILEKYKNE